MVCLVSVKTVPSRSSGYFIVLFILFSIAFFSKEVSRQQSVNARHLAAILQANGDPLQPPPETFVVFPPLYPISIIFGTESYVLPKDICFPNEKSLQNGSDHFVASFVTMGDWGVHDLVQIRTATQLTTLVDIIQAHFLLSLGDNFYEYGVAHVDAPEWNTYFEEIYNSEPLINLPFFSILGNHDYRGNPWAQVARTYSPMNSRWFMPNYWYYQFIHFNDTVAEFEMNPFSKISHISEYQDTSLKNGNTANVSAVFLYLDTIVLSMGEDQDLLVPYEMNVPELLDLQYKFMEEVLLKAVEVADWIFVVGHYHVVTDEVKHEIETLKQYLKPLFKKYKVDGYFHGHLHSLSMFKDEETTYINSGGGGRAPSPSPCTRSECLFGCECNGLSSHILTPTQMYSALVDIDGNVVFAHTQYKTDKSEFRKAVSTREFPAIKRVYIGPNPADSAPLLKVLWFTVMGLLVGVGIAAIALSLSFCCYKGWKKFRYHRIYVS